MINGLNKIATRLEQISFLEIPQLYQTLSPNIYTNRKREADAADEGGSLTVFEKESLPFNPKRIYFVRFGNEGTVRGGHGHYETEQVFIALNGKIMINMAGFGIEQSIMLDAALQESSAIYVPAGVWHTMAPCEPNAMMCVYASTEYDPNDYFYDKTLDISKHNEQ